MKRPDNAHEFVAWNEEMVRRYDPDTYHTASSLPIRLLERLRVHRVRELLHVQPDSRVLEIGCGGGNVLERMPGRRVGIDLSTTILGKARTRLGPSVGLVRGDALRLPFADGAFDRVYCSEVLEHVLDPEAVIAEMRRVTATGGLAVLSVPNEDLINHAKQVAFRLPFGRRLLGGGSDGYQVSEKMDDEWHLHAFGKERLLAAIGDHFRVQRLLGVPAGLLPLRYVAQLAPR